ncbi:MAG: peptide deformylase [Myxococcota bacterium]|nr:peptide deformylase [Myxococcota bacterium]
MVAQRPDFDIVTRQSPTCRVLRQRTRRVQPLVDLSIIASRMEATMLAAKGVGVAGPQVGLNLRIATLMLDYKSDKPRIQSFRNPFIIERSDDSVEGYEGCLSIPGVGGMVRRSSWVRVSHETLKGETLFEEAQGYNAVLWQHELDHLEGILYVDKLLGDLLPMDEVRRRREEMDKAKGSALFHLPDNDIMIA